MRVLHVIRSLDPKCGGPPGAIRSIVPGQVRRGHEVSILTTTIRHRETNHLPLSEFEESIRGESVFEGVNLCIARAYEGYGPARAFAYAPEGIRWFLRRLQEPAGKFDVIHLHEVFSYLHAMIPGLARRNSIPYIFRPAGGLDKMCFNRGHRLLKKAFSYCWLKQGIQGAAFVHVTSLLEAQQIGHLSGWVDADRVRLIPFGFQPDCARDKNSLDRFLARFPELNGRRIILHTARIHAIKRLDWVVEAISLLPREFSDVVLLVAGSDSGYRSVVERAIRNCGLEGRVVFAGFLSDELKEGAFEASSVFVMPSVHENYGFAVVEALAHGVPSVVTRGVASSVYVRDSGAGFVVDDSPTAIAEGLREALSTNLDEVGRKAQEFVRQHLSQESCLDAIDGMYRDSLGNATP